MKAKKGLCLLLSVGLAVTMCTPCAAEEEVLAESAVVSSAETGAEETAGEGMEIPGDITAQSLIDGYIKRNEEATSICAEERMALSMKMAMLGEEMSMKMDMLLNLESMKETDQEISHVIGDMHMMQEGMSEEENAEETVKTEMYAVKEDDASYTVYALNPENGTWTKSTMDGELFNMDLRDLIKGDTYELSEKTVEVDGTACYEVKGLMSLGDMIDYMGSSMEGLSEIFPTGEEDADTYNLDVFYYFNTETKDLVSLKMDGSAMMEKMFMDALTKGMEEAETGTSEEGYDFDMSQLLALFQIDVPEFVVELDHITFDTVESIEIPEEALAAEEGDIDYDWNEDEEAGLVDESITFEGMTAIDNDECAIILEDIDPNDDRGYAIHAELQNKSADKKLTFDIDNAYVNGVESNPYFAVDVAPGKKAKGTISFDKTDAHGITDFSDIEIWFHVYDSEDWSEGTVAKEVVHVYPHGEESAAPYVRESKDTDRVLVDNDMISMIVTDVSEDEWDYTLQLYLQNKTDQDIVISEEDASVNGYMADPYFGYSLAAGKSAFTEMSWSKSVLEEQGIENVEEIEFTLKAYEEDNWSEDGLLKQVVTLTL